MEAQLAEIQQQCTAAESIRNQLTQAQQRAQLAETSAAALQAELATHDRWDAAQKRAQLANLTAQADAAAQAAQQQATALAAQRIPDMETIGRLRGAIVNLETTRKSAEKARAERDQALKALLLAEKDVNESPFAGQTAEEARQDISAPPPIVGRTPASLAAFFGMLALGTALTMLAFARYGAFLSGWMRTLPWLIFSVMTAGGAALSQLICRHAAQSAHLAALQKRFGTADPAVLNALADAYGRALESRDHAQADANAKSAAAEALNSTYTTNEQAILLEVRRFAPAAFHAAAADQALRSCAQQRKALSDAQAAAAQAAARRDLFAQQVPPDSVQEAPLLPPRRSRVEVADALQQAQAELSAARSAADQLSGRLHAMGDPVLLQSAAERLQSQIAQLETEYDALRLAMDTLTGANTTLQNRFSPS